MMLTGLWSWPPDGSSRGPGPGVLVQGVGTRAMYACMVRAKLSNWVMVIWDLPSVNRQTHTTGCVHILKEYCRNSCKSKLFHLKPSPIHYARSILIQTLQLPKDAKQDYMSKNLPFKLLI